MEHLQNEFFVCQCSSDEHTLRFTFDTEEMEIYASVFLNDWQPWYKRLWTATKYLFGFKCKYGHWDSFSMKTSDIARLQKLLWEFEHHRVARDAMAFTQWRERVEKQLAENANKDKETDV